MIGIRVGETWEDIQTLRKKRDPTNTVQVTKKKQIHEHPWRSKNLNRAATDKKTTRVDIREY